MAKYVANPVEVEAFVITKFHPANADCSVDVELDNGLIEVATSAMMSRYVPKEGDYLVIQSDGYIYLNPKDVFERKYRRTDGPRPTIEQLEKLLNSEGGTAPRVDIRVI